MPLAQASSQAECRGVSDQLNHWSSALIRAVSCAVLPGGCSLNASSALHGSNPPPLFLSPLCFSFWWLLFIQPETALRGLVSV